MADVVLSKIASILNQNVENVEQINNSRIIFKYKQKTWELLNAFRNDASELLEIITICENGHLKAVEFVESQDGAYLLAQYKNFINVRRDYQCADEIVGKLFSIIYPGAYKSGFVQNSIETSSEEHHILKRYVTTKLFEALQRKRNNAGCSKIGDVALKLPDKFQPKLCRYQEQSVQWLLMKETAHVTAPDFFEMLKAKDDKTTVYKHLYTHYVQDTPPGAVVLPPGGILAEEMGLGKTVEILALILLNPRSEGNLNLAFDSLHPSLFSKRICLEYEIFCVCSSKSKAKVVQCCKCFLWQHIKCVAKYDSDHDDEVNSPYLCPGCWRDVVDEHGLWQCKSTLIVSPNTIKLQWLTEIRRHIKPSLRVLLYDGMNSGKWISPRQMAGYDIVLTDYNVLRGEVHYTTENITQRATRNKPRSIRKCTPLLMIEWWRVCLDEAQMVESNTSKTASLVRTIPAINRWAVTGTPIQRSLDDLQPLLKFVGFDAAADYRTWNCLVDDFLINHENCLEQNNLELVNVLEKCMWRTSKSQIADELQIPPQQEIIHRIEFDNMEKLFYDELHAECEAKFLEYIRKYTRGMKAVSPQIMKIILQPFLKIRQSCTMPVVVTNVHSNNPSTSQHKQFLQPQELHAYLKSTNEHSCKSELRAMASSHNGLAALYFLQEKYDEAIKHYEAVLKLSKEYNEMNISVDSLLQIHALHNLMQVKIKQSGSISDFPAASYLQSYEEQYNSLEWKYLSTYSATLNTVMTNYETALNKSNAEVGDSLIASTSEALGSLQGPDTCILLEKLVDECMPRFGSTNVKLAEIRSVQALLYIIDLWFSKLKKILTKITSEIDALKYFIHNVKSRNEVSTGTWRNIMQLVHSVYDCHLREIRETQKEKNTKLEKNENGKTKCKMCDIRGAINRLECLLFDKVLDKNSNFTEGLENPSFEMFLCKLLFTYVKNKQQQNGMPDVMENNWIYLENLQIICKRLIKLWIEMEYTIKAYDELNMCKMRISLTDDRDDKSIYKILQHEIAQRTVDTQNELLTAQVEFNKKLARLKYIKHLKDNQEIGPCPICRLAEEDRYAVLECGHHICFQCLQSIRTYEKKSTFKCSVCRNVQQNQDIYFMSRSNMRRQEDDHIKGDYSSKITFIIRLILKLQKEDKNQPNAKDTNHLKILIFSQWMPILMATSLALKENGITFRTQCTPKALEEFKNPQLDITCLLMPFMRGSKGLNLVEATHVFLLEPILNPGEELQAIGRVHRFGQTRPTTVHRFIMMDSIEENIFNFISSSPSNRNRPVNGMDSKWEFDNISLDDFGNLFALKATNM